MKLFQTTESKSRVEVRPDEPDLSDIPVATYHPPSHAYRIAVRSQIRVTLARAELPARTTQ